MVLEKSILRVLREVTVQYTAASLAILATLLLTACTPRPNVTELWKSGIGPTRGIAHKDFAREYFVVDTVIETDQFVIATNLDSLVTRYAVDSIDIIGLLRDQSTGRHTWCGDNRFRCFTTDPERPVVYVVSVGDPSWSEVVGVIEIHSSNQQVAEVPFDMLAACFNKTRPGNGSPAGKNIDYRIFGFLYGTLVVQNWLSL
jgi:hypothetical protein